MGYQERDAHIIDYHVYELPGVKPYPGGGVFRGPRVSGNPYIACVGAAQTFGCFCEKPFPILLTERLGMETLNLGYGGAGPTFHNSNSTLLRHINDARLVIVQVLSGRSGSNSLFRTSTHGSSGTRLSDGKKMMAEDFFSELMTKEPHRVKEVVEETRRNYVRDMIKLLQDIQPPKILFWFSVRKPKYKEQYALPISNFMGAFPQFVNGAIVKEIRKYSNAYVECVSSRGLPQRLFDKKGNPTTLTINDKLLNPQGISWTHNKYYPSSQMHMEAANALVPFCRRYLSPRSSPGIWWMISVARSRVLQRTPKVSNAAGRSAPR